jgi:hypothetical protein
VSAVSASRDRVLYYRRCFRGARSPLETKRRSETAREERREREGRGEDRRWKKGRKMEQRRY